MIKVELFIKLVKPNTEGVSRWVPVTEFVGKYKELKLGNAIDRVRLNGFNNGDFSQYISIEIKRVIGNQRCVILGTSKPEVDYKNGMPKYMKKCWNKLKTLESMMFKRVTILIKKISRYVKRQITLCN